MTFRLLWVLGIAMGLAGVCLARAQTPPDLRAERVAHALAPFVEAAMVEGQIPSLTLALVEGDSVLWTGGFGFSNLWARTPAVPETVYLIGSTFKTIAALALLQLRDAGVLALDDPVRRHIVPLAIAGEDGAQPITFRHLLTHTSGLPVAFDGYPVWGDTAPPPLEDYLRDALAVEVPPSTRLEYSNLGFALVGYVVEKHAGIPFRAYIQQHIFDPLDMVSTAFIPTPEMLERLAVPYEIDPDTRRPVPATALKASVWPAGIVYGTVNDLAHWLLANLNGGVYRGRSILSPASVDEAMTRQFDRFKGRVADLWGGDEAGYGLAWWTDVRDGERYFAHSGSVPGYTAFIQGNRDRRLGIAILSNGHRAHPYLIRLADQAMALLAGAAPDPLPVAAPEASGPR